MRVTYQDACHLAHAQRIRKQPRDLIRALPGVELVEMRHPDICCGAAGLYSTLEPAMSARILQEKLDDVESIGPHRTCGVNLGITKPAQTCPSTALKPLRESHTSPLP